MVRFTTHDQSRVTCWEAAAEWTDALFTPQGLRLDEWRETGRVETVKEGPHRSVYRIALGAGCLYLKHYKAVDWKTRLLNVVRPCRAVLERRAAERISALGIPTFEPLAVGRTMAGGLVGDSYLLSRGIEDAEQLDEFVLRKLEAFSPKERQRIRKQIARELGRLAGAMHGSGVLHRDFHAGNVLLRVEEGGRVRMWLVDLHAVSFPRRLPHRQRRRNLSQLVPFFDSSAGATDRLRFFRAYWEELSRQSGGSPVAAEHYRRTARRVDAYCRKAGARALLRRDRKWVRGNRRLIIADSPTAGCRGLAFLDRRVLESIRDEPERLFHDDMVRRWFKRSARRRVAAITLCSGRSAVSCLVEAVGNRPAGFCDRLARQPGVNGRRAGRRTWETGHALLRRGINTPRPLLFVDTKKCSYVVTEEIPDAVPLDRWMRDTSPGKNAGRRWMDQLAETAEGDVLFSRGESELRSQRNSTGEGQQYDSGNLMRAISARVARQLRRLHDAGFAFPRLSVDKVLVRCDGKDAAVWFRSLESVRRRSRVSTAARIAALADFNASLPQAVVSRAERLRFLKVYLKADFAGQWKRYWRRGIRLVEDVNRRALFRLDFPRRGPDEVADVSLRKSA